jgi:hypothetical protein
MPAPWLGAAHRRRARAPVRRSAGERAAEPAAAIRLQGGSQVAAFCYGTLPNLWPQLLAYSLYRWENNIRMASVLGFVGAGGLGQMLYTSLFQEAQASTVIIAMLVLVLLVDAFSDLLRQRYVREPRRHAPGVAALFLPRRRRTAPVESPAGPGRPARRAPCRRC